VNAEAGYTSPVNVFMASPSRLRRNSRARCTRACLRHCLLRGGIRM